MADDTATSASRGERLAKVIARAGLCSRRDAEKWIADGRIGVNGQAVLTPAVNVTEKDAVSVDGVPLAARAGTRLWLYHKPAGLVVTEKDPEGRETIFEKLADKGLPRVLTVGRLDINTEGLLLLTNDGGLKRVLELPATGWLRKYRVRAFGAIEQDRLDKLKAGTELDGVKYGPIEAVLERVQGGNVWLTVSLREGKNREVKNVLAALGLQVNRLIRVSFGPFQLGDLPIGAVSPVRTRILRDQLGEKLAKKAGVDFDSALPEEPAQDEAKKAPKSPRDPNARLRPRAERAGKPVPAPKPRTGEPRFAKKRAEGKVPPYAATGFDEEKPAKRRVLFDDGRELVEDAPRPRRDRGDKRGFDTGKPVSRSARPQAKSYGDRPAGRTGGKPHSRTGGKPGASRPSGQGPSRPRRPARPGSGKPRN